MAAETTPPIRPTGPTDSPQDGPEDDCPKLSPWLFVVENVYLAALLAIGAWYVWPDSSLAPTPPHSPGFIPVEESGQTYQAPIARRAARQKFSTTRSEEHKPD